MFFKEDFSINSLQTEYKGKRQKQNKTNKKPQTSPIRESTVKEGQKFSHVSTPLFMCI